MGVVRVSAPVYDKKGKVVACLGVAAPSFRITAQNRDKIGKCSKKLAQKLSTELQAQTGGNCLA
jgi:DNA-binding IclR family transcriptional regulator